MCLHTDTTVCFQLLSKFICVDLFPNHGNLYQFEHIYLCKHLPYLYVTSSPLGALLPCRWPLHPILTSLHTLNSMPTMLASPSSKSKSNIPFAMPNPTLLTLCRLWAPHCLPHCTPHILLNSDILRIPVCPRKDALSFLFWVPCQARFLNGSSLLMAVAQVSPLGNSTFLTILKNRQCVRGHCFPASFVSSMNPAPSHLIIKGLSRKLIVSCMNLK